jgi:hypothetical protein
VQDRRRDDHVEGEEVVAAGDDRRNRHGSRGRRPPAPETIIRRGSRSKTMHRRRSPQRWVWHYHRKSTTQMGAGHQGRVSE